MPDFTPGPWVIEDYGVGIFSRSGDCSIVDLAEANSDKEKIANARLIAAAPDMYFTLQLVIFALGLDNSGKSSFISVSEEHAIFLARKIEALLARIDGSEDHAHDTDA